MNQFQCINFLLEFDIVGGERSLRSVSIMCRIEEATTISTHLIICLTQLFLEVLRTSLSKWRYG